MTLRTSCYRLADLSREYFLRSYAKYELMFDLNSIGIERFLVQTLFHNQYKVNNLVDYNKSSNLKYNKLQAG